jgi:chromosome partitioning protein
MGACNAEEALQKPELEQLWVIPSHKNLIGANLELVDAERREFRMRDAIAPLRERFQFIVLDCPPALDLLTLNALVAADSVLIPMQAEYFALEGISELLDTIDRIRHSFNPLLEVEGVVLTMFDERTNLAQQVAKELRKYFGKKLCRTSIPRNVRLAEAPSHGKPALVYDVRSRGAESYIRLAKEILGAEARRRREAEAAAAQTAAAEIQPQVSAEPTPAPAVPEAITPADVPAMALATDAPPGSEAAVQPVSQSEQTVEQSAESAPGPAEAGAPAMSSPAENPSPPPDMATAQSEAATEAAPDQPPSPPEAYPSLPPPAIAEAVLQAAQPLEAQPVAEQGD